MTATLGARRSVALAAAGRNLVYYRTPEAPAGAITLVTDDVHALAEFRGRSAPEPVRVVHGGGPAECIRQYVCDGTGRIAWISMTGPTTLRGQSPAPTLHLLLSASARYVVGRRTLDAGPGDAVLLPGDVALTIKWQPGRAVGVRLPSPALEDALQARRGGRGAPAIRMCRLPVDARSGASLTDALAAYVEAIASGGTALERTRNAVADWLADASLAAAAVVPVEPLRAARARRLERWIDAHLAERIDLARLCEIARVTPRCLQKTFQARHGTSPLEFVMQRRLLAAREQLMRASDETGVTKVALEVGMTHMGRFSARYRATFGEPPSSTLRRRRAETSAAR